MKELRLALGQELRSDWIYIVIAVTVWVGTIAARTPALGFNLSRVLYVILMTGATITIGVYAERIRRDRQDLKEKKKKP